MVYCTNSMFLCVQILPQFVFNKKDPIVLGVDIAEGIAKVGTPLCIPSQNFITIGKIASMEMNHKDVDIARKGDSVAMKIQSTNASESARLYGRHFDHNDELVSHISRHSIDLLKVRMFKRARLYCQRPFTVDLSEFLFAILNRKIIEMI